MTLTCYRPKRSFGQGNIFTPVCHSVHRGEYLTRYPPRDQVHPPWDQVHPPGTRYTPRDQVPPRDQEHPPGLGTPPRDQVHPPGPGTPPRDQVHPPTRSTPPRTRDTPRRARYPPGTRYTPPGTRYTPPEPGTPPPGCKLRNTVNDRPVRILLECILVIVMFSNVTSCKRTFKFQENYVSNDLSWSEPTFKQILKKPNW